MLQSSSNFSIISRIISFSGRGRGVASDRITNEDTDESEEAKDNTLSTIGSLDNDALAALAQRSPRSSKYNFFPDFGKSLSYCIIAF